MHWGDRNSGPRRFSGSHGTAIGYGEMHANLVRSHLDEHRPSFLGRRALRQRRRPARAPRKHQSDRP